MVTAICVPEAWPNARSNLVPDWPFIAGCIPSPSLCPDSLLQASETWPFSHTFFIILCKVDSYSPLCVPYTSITQSPPTLDIPKQTHYGGISRTLFLCALITSSGKLSSIYLCMQSLARPILQALAYSAKAGARQASSV